MDITFNCDACGQEIVIDQDGAGSVVECPKCRASVMVPVGSGIAAEEGSTDRLPLLPRVPAVPSAVIVQKIEGLPLTVTTAEDPLRVIITDIRLSFAARFCVLWDWALTALVVSLVFGIIGSIIGFIIYAIYAVFGIGR